MIKVSLKKINNQILKEVDYYYNRYNINITFCLIKFNINITTKELKKNFRLLDKIIELEKNTFLIIFFFVNENQVCQALYKLERNLIKKGFNKELLFNSIVIEKKHNITNKDIIEECLLFFEPNELIKIP